MNSHAKNSESTRCQSLVGTWQRFGEAGIVYQITAVEDAKTLQIKVLDTGEELSYPLKRALNDPNA